MCPVVARPGRRYPPWTLLYFFSRHSLRGGCQPTKRKGGVRGGSNFPSPDLSFIQAAPATAGSRGTAPGRRAPARRQARSREAREEPADGDAPLQPRQIEPGAMMRAGAEGQVPVGLAADVEAVGVRELGRVAVGGADADGDEGAGRHRDAADLDGAVARGCRAGWSFRSAGTPRRALWISPGSASAAPSPRDSQQRSRPLPIRLVVVSWPAFRMKMMLCSSSRSESRSPSRLALDQPGQHAGGGVAADARAAVGDQAAEVVEESVDGGIAARRAPAAPPARARRGWPATSRAAARVPRPARRAGCRSPRSGWRRRSPRSGRPRPCQPSHRAGRRPAPTRGGSIPPMARGVSAPMISRRTRVCSGGSLKTRLVVWCS